MNHLPWLTRWAADEPLFEQLGSNFRGPSVRWDGGDAVTALIGLAILVLAFWALSRLLASQERRRRTNSPQGLFQELCRAHGLDWSSRRLLARLARHHQLQHPSRLFIEPDRFAPLPPRLESNAPQFEALHRKLFS